MSVDAEMQLLRAELRWEPLSRNWARFEILLGLAGFVVGLLIAQSPDMISPLSGIAAMPVGALLSILGGYLVLAGHRSHLYQSNTKLAAYLILRCATRTDSETTPSQKPDATDRSNLSGSHDC